jgi:hypothetical protein
VARVLLSTSAGGSLMASSHKFAVVLCAFLLVNAAVPARAQTPPNPATDFSLGYQALHIPGQNYPFGVVAGMSHAITDLVRIVGEAGVSIDQQSSTNLNGTLTLYHYGVGPRFTMASGRVQPFAQVLAGGVHTRADLTTAAGAPFSSSGNAFMLQPGAGVIVPLTRTFAVIGAVNYRRVFFDVQDNETSGFAGIRIAFR